MTDIRDIIEEVYNAALLRKDPFATQKKAVAEIEQLLAESYEQGQNNPTQQAVKEHLKRSTDKWIAKQETK